MRFSELRSSIVSDKKINSKKSFIILLKYRITNYFYTKNNRLCGGVISVLLMLFSILDLLLSIDAQISYKAVIGKNIKLPHSANGVVISSKAKIGNNVTIFHQCTIGINESKPIDEQFINIGNNCILSAGCKIISCSIGDNCHIGANAVVVKDLPKGSLCYSLCKTVDGYYL